MNELLKNNGLKNTKQRQLILQVIESLTTEATTKNILKRCSNHVDKSTVYRIIDLFLEHKIIEKGINYNEEIYYYLKESHIHYFTCIKCHKQEKIEICPIDNLTYLYVENKKYDIVDHTILLTGICPNCKRS